MLQIAPPIQAPSESILAQLVTVLEKEQAFSGPLFAFDAERQVFLVAVAEAGVLVHWQLECCRDKGEADQLKRRYAAMAADVVVDQVLTMRATQATGPAPH